MDGAKKSESGSLGGRSASVGSSGCHPEKKVVVWGANIYFSLSFSFLPTENQLANLSMVACLSL